MESVGLRGSTCVVHNDRMPSTRVRPLVMEGAAPYVLAVAVTQVVGHASRRIELGQGDGSLLPALIFLIGSAATVVLWLRCESSGRRPALLGAFLALAMALSTAALLRAALRHESVALDAVLAVGLVLMVWVKPPSSTDARRIVDGLAWIFAVTALAALALEASGVLASWYGDGIEGIATRDFDSSYYWLPLQGPLGIDGRWAGPFEHPNHAGPAGAFLLVVGVARGGRRSWVFIAVGLLVLVLTASRTSAIAALLGTTTALLVMWSARRRSLSPSIPVLAFATPAALLALLGVTAGKAGSVAEEGSQLSSIVSSTASLMGRTEVWGAYWRLWQESPLVGVSKDRVLEAVDAGVIPPWARGSAHNLLLDYLARSGILGTVLLLACLTVVAVMAARSARRGQPIALGLIVILATCSITEVLIYWQTLATSTLILWAAVFASLEQGQVVEGTSSRDPVSAVGD